MTNKQKHNTLPLFPNAAFDIVAIAASLGGLKALSQVLSALPRGFPAAIVVVQHLEPQRCSQMSEILSQRTHLLVKQAESGDELRPGKVYIAPPNNHLLVNADGTLLLSQTERVNFVRPAADNLFESAAVNFKERAIAVVLTGRDGDGAKGVRFIKEMGGTVIAQDEDSCESSSMPNAAIATGSVDFVLPLNEIASAIVNLVRKKTGQRSEIPLFRVGSLTSDL